MVKDPPANAGDTRFKPWSRKIPRDMEQLISPCTPTTKPALQSEPQLLKPAHLEPVLHNKRSCRNEKPAQCNEEWPLLATTRENPRAAAKTQLSQK